MDRGFENIKCCIWDVDLTLYTVSLELKREFKDKIYQYVSQKLKISLDEARKRYEKEFRKKKGKTASMVALGLGKYAIQEVIDSIDKSNFLKRDPDLIQLFNNLTAYKHIIVSNSARTSVRKTLKTLGLKENLFKAIITREDVSTYKPSPEPFLKALDMLGAKAEECVSIGDVDESDIIPARELGMKTIFVWGKSKYADVSVTTVYYIGKLLI